MGRVSATQHRSTRERAMRSVKAAAVQLSPVLYSREGTVEKIVRSIHELGRRRVQFATFPETVIPYYPYFSFVQSPLQNIVGPEQRKLLDQAVTVPSAATDALGEAARQAGVVVSIGVNERDGGTLYNTQLLFDADGALLQRRRKTTPTYHERMIWGQGDGSGLRAVDSRVGRIGQLACWEHYNPLARYALMADGEQIHSAMYPGSIFGRVVRAADGSERPAARARIRVLCGVRDGVAQPRATGADREGHRRRWPRDLGRLLHRDSRAGREPAARPAALGRGRRHRRP